MAFAAGDLVLLGAGDALGLGAGEGDFLVAAEAAKGAQHAMAAMYAVMICNLFFMVGVVVRFRF
jgi:hypothetical protein